MRQHYSGKGSVRDGERFANVLLLVKHDH